MHISKISKCTFMLKGKKQIKLEQKINGLDRTLKFPILVTQLNNIHCNFVYSD